MATLPKTPFQLRGGCLCSSIQYTINVPELASRPIIPEDRDEYLVPRNEVNSHLPLITLDHCNSCRRAPGAIVESWFICPQSWIEFRLKSRPGASKVRDESLDAKEEQHFVQPTTLEVLKPDETLTQSTYLSHHESSLHSERTFCGKCGTHLTFLNSGPKGKLGESWGPYCDVSVGSMDKESVEIEGFAPFWQVWEEEGISWVVKMFNEGVKASSG